MAKVYVSNSDRDIDSASRIMDWLRFQDYEPVTLSQEAQNNRDNLSLWHREIAQTLEFCDLVILVLTPEWVNSKWCLAEFTNAYSIGKTIFAVIEEPLEKEFSEPGISVFDLTVDRENGLSQLANALRGALPSSVHSVDFDPDRQVYPGLKAYEEQDSAIFFSRDDDIRRVIDRLNTRRRQGGARLLALLGAPGTGMSSLLKGGVLPRMQKDRQAWIVLPVMRPYLNPIEELSKSISLLLGHPELWEEWAQLFRGSDFKGVARELAEQLRERFNAPDAHILLPIDQGEELFSISNESDSSQFLDILGAILDDDMPYVGIVALRPDFLEAYQTADQLSHIIEEFSPRLLPLSSIREIITGPGKYVNIDIPDELVDRILSDALEEGALPLVAFVLNYLYRNGLSDGHLSLEVYNNIGSDISGQTPLGNIIGKIAEDILTNENLTDIELDDLSEVFNKSLLWTDNDNRFVVQPSNLADCNLKTRVLVQKFIEVGLMVSRKVNNDEMVEYTHLAILDNWPRLRDWVNKSQDTVVNTSNLTGAVETMDNQDLQEVEIENTGDDFHQKSYSSYRFEEKSADQDNFIDEAHKYVQAEILNQDENYDEEDRFSKPPNIFAERAVDNSNANIELDYAYQDSSTSGAENVDSDYQENHNTNYDDYSQNQILTPKPLVSEEDTYKRERKSKTGIAALIIFVVASISLGAIFWSAIEKQIFNPGNDVTVAEDQNVINNENSEGTDQNKISEISQQIDQGDWPLLKIYNIFSDLQKSELTQKDKKSYEIDLVNTLRNMQNFLPLDGHSAQVGHVSFSPDGLYLASSSKDYTVRLWDIMTGKTVMIFEGHTGEVNSVAFSPDSKQILTSSDDKSAKLWDVKTGEIIKTFNDHDGAVRFSIYRSSGNQVITATQGGLVYIWDIQKGDIVRKLEGHKGAINHIDISSNGSWLATASDDKTTKIWDLVSGQNMLSILGHKGAVNTVEFSEDNNYVLTASNDKTVVLWQTFSGKQERIFSNFDKPVISAAFSTDERMVISTTNTGAINLLNQKTGATLHVFNNKRKSFRRAVFSPDGKWIASGSQTKNAFILPTALYVSNKIFSGHNDQLNSASMNDTNEFVATASKDKTVRVWNIDTAESAQLNGHTAPVLGTSFHPTDEIIATASEDQTIRTWALDGQNLQTFEGHENSINSVSFSPDGNILASASSDKTLRVWDHNTGTLLSVLKGHQDSVTSAVFSSDGETLYSSSVDQTVRVWNRKTGEQVALLKHSAPVTKLSLSPDGQILASASESNEVTFWNLEKLEKGPITLKHKQKITSLDYSADGKSIITGSYDKVSRIWDVSSGKVLWYLKNDKSPVLSASLSKSGGWALTTEENNVKLWRILSGLELAFYAKSILPRCLQSEEIKNMDLDANLTKWCVGQQAHNR